MSDTESNVKPPTSNILNNKKVPFKNNINQTYFSDTESNKKLSQKDKSTKTKENVNLKE